MELLRHELYKIFSRKILWVATVFFLAVTAFFVYNQSSLYIEQFGEMNTFYSSVYKGHEGTVNVQEVAAAEKENQNLLNQLNPLLVHSEKSILLQRRIDYDSAISNANANANTRISRISEYLTDMKSAKQKYGENSFAYRDSTMRYDMTKSLVLPGVYFTYPWNNILDFPVTLGFLILVAMILLGVSPIFSDEYATGVDALILSSRFGKGKIAGIKAIAGTIYCASVALLFTTANMFGYFIALGTDGSSAPFQSIFKYLASPYAFTIGQYFTLETLTYMIAGVCFGLLVMLVSSFSKNALIPFFTCGCLIGLTAGIKVMDMALPGPLSLIEDFSYSELMRVTGLFSEYKTFNILGYPVLYGPLALGYFAVLTIIITWFTIRNFRFHQIENA